MSDPRTTLVLGAVPHAGVPIVRCLARHGVEVVAAGFEGRAAMLRCRGVRSLSTLPDPSSEGYLRAFLDLVARERVDMVMPCSDVALAALARDFDSIRGVVRTAGPTVEAARIVLDKAKTYEIAAACGISVPQSYAILDGADLDSRRNELSFPLVAKPNLAGGVAPSFKVRYFEDPGALRMAFDADSAFGRSNVLQQYIEGSGLGVAMLRHGGKIVATFLHRRLKELPASGGVSVLCEAVPPDATAAKASADLLLALDWEGPALVEFRRRADGSCVLMEVNGRYWGSIGLPIAAGIEFPWYHWQIAHGRDPDVPSTYAAGVRMRWLAGDMQRLSGIWRGIPPDALHRSSPIAETVRFAADFNLRNKSALATISDPMPEIAEVGELAATWLSRAARALVTRLFPSRRRRAAAQLLVLGSGPLLYYARRSMRARDRGPSLLDAASRGLPSILFVCSGNAMRSPMSEALLRRDAAQAGVSVNVASAGTRAVADKPAHPWARRTAGSYGLSLESHRGKMLTRELAASFDAIVIFDFFNEADVLARFPELRSKVYLLSSCDPDPKRPPEIDDPDGTTVEELQRCYARIAECVAALTRHLAGGDQPVANDLGPDNSANARSTSGKPESIV